MTHRYNTEHITLADVQAAVAIIAGGPGSGPHVITTKRGPNFEFEGIHHVFVDGEKKHEMFRSTDNGWWYRADSNKHYSQNVIGFNKKEAIAHFEKMYNPEIKAGGPGSGRTAEEFHLKPGAIIKPAPKVVEKKEPTQEQLVKQGMSKKWKHQTEDERHAIAKTNTTQKKLFAGGPGSGRHKGLDSITHEESVEKKRLKQLEQRRELNKQGLSQRGKPIVSDKAKRALANMNVATKVHQDLAEATEKNIAGHLKGSVKATDNSPFDVVHTVNGKKHGIEVKAIVTQKNDKITQKTPAIARKMAYAKANGIKRIHTVAVDYRGTTPVVYHKEGVGSFRLGSMTKVKGGFNGLSEHIR